MKVEGAFFLPKKNKTLTSQIPQYFYEYKNPKKNPNSHPYKKERRCCGQFFYLFFKYPNAKSLILGCFWGSGGVGMDFGELKKGWDL
jgi:hypothetical protein